MTTLTDIANRALQVLGTRTTVTAGELVASSTNEAIQLNLILTNYRRDLLRMAPWNFATKTANLNYITSTFGTPENSAPAPTLWAPGQPRPPWAYEYQWPNDCLKALWIIPATQTGFAGGVPITTAVTGGAPSFWYGPPVKFAVGNDAFFAVTTATVASGGTGFVVGEVVTLAQAPQGSPPVGAPLQLQVTGQVGGVITSVAIVPAVIDETIGGSYFAPQPNPVAMGSSTGNGTGATFNLTFASAATPQRVILCNQEFASLVYVQDIADPNIMDDQFQKAYASLVGAGVTMALTGDLKIANQAIKVANDIIAWARANDGSEGLTVNDTTPDWLRIRGIDIPQSFNGPSIGFDWGSMWPYYG